MNARQQSVKLNQTPNQNSNNQQSTKNTRERNSSHEPTTSKQNAHTTDRVQGACMSEWNENEWEMYDRTTYENHGPAQKTKVHDQSSKVRTSRPRLNISHAQVCYQIEERTEMLKLVYLGTRVLLGG